MPMLNGYSIYVAAPHPQRQDWIVRVYRDSDDTHIHSAEGCHTLSLGLREAERAITEDVNRPTIPEPPSPKDALVESLPEQRT